MSAPRRVLSCFIAWHLIALTVRALPSPELLPETQGNSGSAPAVPPTEHRDGALTQGLDAAAATLRPIALGLERLARPIAWPADAYMKAIGFAQTWRMFSIPPTVAQYVRLRYYVAGQRSVSGGAEWSASELIVPALPENRVRLARSYLDSSRDKAVMVALENFHKGRRSVRLRPDIRPDELPDYVAPVVRFFSRRFEQERLRPDERVVRVEFWYGVAPIAAPGSPDETSLRSGRAPFLQPYYDGVVESRLAITRFPPYLSREQEGDITWVLDYFEHP